MSEKKPILTMIQEIQESEEQRPVVLPLMCGAGKSQSIAAKIKDAIIKNEGLLIVTDRTSRFNDYLEPRDQEIKSFIDHHRDQITVMKSSMICEAYIKCSETPILIMTTQRYFGLEIEEIRRLLEYKENGENKKRHLIIFDEKPDLYFQFNIDIKEVDQFNSAFMLGINDSRDYGIKRDLYFHCWCRLRESICESLLMHETFFSDKDQYMLWEPQYPHDDKPLTIKLDGLSDEDREFAREIAASDYYNITLPQKLQEFAREKRRAMYEANQCDPVKLLRALYLRHKLSFYTFRGIGTGSYASYITVIENEKEKLTNVDAKVIILDGTADLSPEYNQDYLYVDSESCKPYIRSIPNLQIKLVKYSLSKKSAKNISKETYKMLEKYVQDDSRSEKVCVFTHMNIVQAFSAL